MRNEKGGNKIITRRLLFLFFLKSSCPYPSKDSYYFLFTLSCIMETNKNYTPFINTQPAQLDHKLFDGNSLLIFFYTSYPFCLLEVCTVKVPVCQFCWPTWHNYSHVTIESFKDSSCKLETGFFFFKLHLIYLTYKVQREWVATMLDRADNTTVPCVTCICWMEKQMITLIKV